MVQDAAQIKGRILSFLRMNGPSIPVYISQAAGLSILFTSAFLSELFSERQLKISNMRVGSSPVYFIPGQEPQLEKFSSYLKSKEKEAYLLLKEKRFLKDSEMEPAIRVALREIKDFAFPFQKNDETYWRYFTSEESEFGKKHPPEKPHENPNEEEERGVSGKDSEDLDIFENPEEREEEKPKPARKKSSSGKTKKTTSKSSAKKTAKKPKEDSKFFNKVKEFLSEKGIEIIDIEEIAIKKIIFRVKEEKEYLIIAYNKKRITEEDITKAYKKAQELGLEYKILCFGDTLKKIENLVNAAKTLKGIEKIE